MEGQLTIFDYLIEETPSVKWHPIIDELSEDIHKLFKDCDIKKETYEVWEHVANLGKRYECFVYVKDDKDVINLSFAPLVEKYKKKSLEVSISSTGSFKDGYSHSLMISSLWNTKGHREP
jgi:hypothetical protein